MGWTIGVDVGGTFTDFYAANNAAGIFHVYKTSSTPLNPADAILNGIDAMCEKFDIPKERIERVSHGTTVGTNALIQRSGSRVALITTKGFRDLLEIGRQTRPHMYDLQKDYPAPSVVISPMVLGLTVRRARLFGGSASEPERCPRVSCAMGWAMGWRRTGGERLEQQVGDALVDQVDVVDVHRKFSLNSVSMSACPQQF